MKKILLTAAVLLLTALLCASCAERPKKNNKVYTENTSISENTVTEEVLSEKEPETDLKEQAEEPLKEAEPVEEDTRVYTADELTDEQIKAKLVGYWEFNTFGYVGGYNFFDSGFLQLVLEREVSQTGIYSVRYKGIYFSLDGKSWDEDVLMIQTISNTELVGTFGEDVLVLHKSDASLIKENSGIMQGDSDSSSGIIDAATEIDRNVKVN